MCFFSVRIHGSFLFVNNVSSGIKKEKMMGLRTWLKERKIRGDIKKGKVKYHVDYDDKFREVSSEEQKQTEKLVSGILSGRIKSEPLKDSDLKKS